MEKETIIKIQIILLCISIVSFELAIYLLLPSLVTILIMLSLNTAFATFVLERLSNTLD